MTTSGSGPLNSLLYSLLLAVSLMASVHVLLRQGARLRAPAAPCVMLWLLVAIPSLVQFAWHPIYDQLSRQPAAIHRGQLWRLVTSAAVQDGGVAGTLFNLVSLAVILALAERLWAAWAVVLLSVVGVVAFNVMATYVSPSAGGGNSAMTFFVAASIVGLMWVRHRSAVTALAAAVTAVVGVVLLALLDAHGEAVLAGLLIGVLLVARRLPQR